MSKKRTSDDSSNDEQRNGGNNAQRARLALLSDTTLEDLPMELIECILIKVIVMEVKDLKLAESVWKEKGDLVISRLSNVGSQWSNVLATDFFRNVLHRTLDRTSAPSHRLEILRQSQIQPGGVGVAALRADLLILRYHSPHYALEIHDRINPSLVKQVLRLPGMWPLDMVTSGRDDCLFILVKIRNHWAVVRGERQTSGLYKLSTWIHDIRSPASSIGISPSGQLFVYRKYVATQSDPPSLTIYNDKGQFQSALTLSPAVYGFRTLDKIMITDDGKIILSCIDLNNRKQLKEIDASGKEIRSFGIALSDRSEVVEISSACRLLVLGERCSCEMVDMELNLVPFQAPQIPGNPVTCPRAFPVAGNDEFIRLDLRVGNGLVQTVTTFRVTEC